MIVTPAVLRQIAGTFPTGVAVVTTSAVGRLYGCTVNAVTSLSLDPPLMLVCLDRMATTHPQLLESGAFAINFIRVEEGSEELCRAFARKSKDKFGGVGWRPGVTGSPVLDAALSVIECELATTYDGGDHTIFVGRVVAAEEIGGEPLLLHRGRFRGLGRER